MNPYLGSGLAAGFVRVCLAMVGVVIVLQFANQKVSDSKGVSKFPRLLTAARHDENVVLPPGRRLSQSKDFRFLYCDPTKNKWVDTSRDNPKAVRIPLDQRWASHGCQMQIDGGAGDIRLATGVVTGNNAGNSPSAGQGGRHGTSGSRDGDSAPQNTGMQDTDDSVPSSGTRNSARGSNTGTNPSTGQGGPHGTSDGNSVPSQHTGMQGSDDTAVSSGTRTNPTANNPSIGQDGGTDASGVRDGTNPTGLNAKKNPGNNPSTGQDVGSANIGIRGDSSVPLRNSGEHGGYLTGVSGTRNDRTGIHPRINPSTGQDVGSDSIGSRDGNSTRSKTIGKTGDHLMPRLTTGGRTNNANASKPEASTTNDSDVIIDDRQFENMTNTTNNFTSNAKDSPLELPLAYRILVIGLAFLSVICACVCMIGSFLHTRTDKKDSFDIPDSPSDMEDAVE